MKVLKEGKLPELKETNFTCSKCKCEFIAMKSEFKRYVDYDGEFWTIQCPTPRCDSTFYKYSW